MYKLKKNCINCKVVMNDKLNYYVFNFLAYNGKQNRL